MSQNIKIRRDGEDLSADVDCLRVPKIGGGAENWVPEGTQNKVKLTVGNSGTYTAEEFGATGISEVLVEDGESLTSSQDGLLETTGQGTAITVGGKQRLMKCDRIDTRGALEDVPWRRMANLGSIHITREGIYKASQNGYAGYKSVTVDLSDAEPWTDDPLVEDDTWYVPLAIGANKISPNGQYGYDRELSAGDGDFFIPLLKMHRGGLHGCNSYAYGSSRDVGAMGYYYDHEVIQYGKSYEKYIHMPADEITISPNRLTRYTSGDILISIWPFPQSLKSVRPYSGKSIYFTYTTESGNVYNQETITTSGSVRSAILIKRGFTESGKVLMFIEMGSTEPFTCRRETRKIRTYTTGINTPYTTETTDVVESAAYYKESNGYYWYELEYFGVWNNKVSPSITFPLNFLTLPYDLNYYTKISGMTSNGICLYLARPDHTRKFTVTWKRPQDGRVLSAEILCSNLDNGTIGLSGYGRFPPLEEEVE